MAGYRRSYRPGLWLPEPRMRPEPPPPPSRLEPRPVVIDAPERAREEQWPFEQFLEVLLEAEVFAREASGRQTAHSPRRLPAHKTLEAFDLTAQPFRQSRWRGTSPNSPASRSTPTSA